MNTFKKTLLASVVALGFAAPAMATETSVWQTFEKWTVRVDSNLGFGCFMQANYLDGTLLRVGLNVARDQAYVEIGNLAWSSLVAGQTVSVTMSMDGIGPQVWTGTVTTLTTGHRVIYFPTGNFKFLDALAAHSSIQIGFGGQTVLNGSLYGSGQAVHSMAECQSAFMATGPARPVDPFRGAAPVRDPFKSL